jgi:hypothetical protein
MKLDWAILANSAEVRDNMAYVLGGGIDTVNSFELPAPLNATLLLRILLHRTEVERPHNVEVRALDNDGNEIAPRLHLTFTPPPIAPDTPIGWDIPVMFPIVIQRLPLKDASRYSLEILIDDTHFKSLNLKVNLLEPPPAIPLA